jgi:hypothetical protein
MGPGVRFKVTLFFNIFAKKFHFPAKMKKLPGCCISAVFYIGSVSEGYRHSISGTCGILP